MEGVVPVNNNVIPMDVVVRSVRVKRHLYEGFQRNNYWMPSMVSSICTQEWMEGVREGRYWCPRATEVRLANCP